MLSKLKERFLYGFLEYQPESRLKKGLYKDYFFEFITDYKFIIPIVAIILVGFLFEITHTSVSIDDLSRDRYINGELFAQGRITDTVLCHLLQLNHFVPFVDQFLSLILMVAGATLFCVLLKVSTNNSLHPACYVLFSCLLISYPLLAEIFVYFGATLAIGFCYFTVPLALLLIYKFTKNPKISLLIYSSIVLCFTISAYESFAIVYICGVFMVLLSVILYNKENNKKLFSNFKKLIIYSLPLLIGIIMEELLSKWLMIILNLEKSSNGANSIWYFIKGIDVFKLIEDTFRGIWSNYFEKAFIYLPLTILVLCIVVVLIFMVYYSCKHKSLTTALLFLGLLLTLILLSVAQGTVSPYRTCQVFSLFVAFAFVMIIQSTCLLTKTKAVRYSVIAFASLIAFQQANYLNETFYMDYLRYESELNTITQISYKLDSSYDVTKPVVFVGYIMPPANVNKFFASNGKRTVQTVDLSYVTWGVHAFNEPNTELLKFFTLNGHNYIQGTEAQYSKGLTLKKDMPSWPKDGSIMDVGEFILVKLG